MAAELAAQQLAASFLFKKVSAKFTEAVRAAEAFSLTCQDCDQSLCVSLLNLCKRASMCANTDTGLGCMSEFPRVRERLLAKQVDQVNLVIQSLQSKMYDYLNH
jgi:hypothetical protein